MINGFKDGYRYIYLKKYIYAYIQYIRYDIGFICLKSASSYRREKKIYGTGGNIYLMDRGRILFFILEFDRYDMGVQGLDTSTDGFIGSFCVRGGF